MTTIPLLILIEIIFIDRLLRRGAKLGIDTLPVWVLFLTLLAWAAGSAILGYRAIYVSDQMKAVYPGYWLPVIPVAIVVVMFVAWSKLRQVLRQLYQATPAAWFIWIHTIRLAAIGGLYKATTGQFNERFAYTVGIPDFIFGMSALIMGMSLLKKQPGQTFMIVWNAIGAGVILVPMFGFMHWHVQEPEFYRLFEFPMSMAPTFIVPLLIMINAWSVWVLWTGKYGEQAR